eukprot:TRINITY_DN500_c0_g1_i2.p1 TRINITY_DN500_c0_g1~~TRINITY_DN500_c0_g1_i2.p1  ORF type:complete len:598 (+),score=165.53 TRINITY_DN500_c0_g1_i2:18-1811(+)
MLKFASKKTYRARSSAPKRRESSRKPRPSVDTNVVSVSLGNLGDISVMMTGDPVSCENCKAYFTQSSILSDDDIWVCEFCGHSNLDVYLDDEEIPKSDTVDYLQHRPDAIDSINEENLLVIVLDISGSMTVTQEVDSNTIPNLKVLSQKVEKELEEFLRDAGSQYMPQEKQSIQYVTRLQCCQLAIDGQLEELKKSNPSTKVVLVCFSSDVVILGDGINETVTIAGDRLNDYDALLQIGREYNQNLKPISESREELSRKLFSLQEHGQTALGPALVCALGMAKNGAASRLLVATDGLANIGVGQMDFGDDPTEAELTEMEKFYDTVSLMAKEDGTVVNIVSIPGSDCNIENLGKLADETNGKVDIVQPTELATNFGFMLDDSIIATHCQVKVMLHPLLFNRDDNSNIICQDIGNVNSETESTFSYGINEDLLKEKFGDEMPEFLPFQLQVVYKLLDGSQYIRIVNYKSEVTENREEAESNIDIGVLGTNFIQKTSSFAQEGRYKKAQNYLSDQRSYIQNLASNEDDLHILDNIIGDAGELEEALEVELEREADAPVFASKSMRNVARRRGSQSYLQREDALTTRKYADFCKGTYEYP